MKAVSRLFVTFALVAVLGVPAFAPAGATADAEPCGDAMTRMCSVRTFFFHADTTLTEEPGDRLAVHPYTFSFQWNGTIYRGSADVAEDFTFPAEESMTLRLFRYATRADTFTTLVEARAVGPGSEEIVLTEGAVFVAGVPAMEAERAVAGDESADQEGWNVLAVDFGREVTVPAGWTIEVQVRTFVGEGHPEEPYLQRLHTSRTNPDALPRPTFLVRHDTAEYPSSVDFRLVQG